MQTLRFADIKVDVCATRPDGSCRDVCDGRGLAQASGSTVATPDFSFR
jgi:hypothetical protein